MKLKRTMTKSSQEDLKDLGFGSRVSNQTAERLLNKDGSFNVQRSGLPFFTSLSPYHSLLTMSWWKFNINILVFFISINALFALAFVLIGKESLPGSAPGSILQFYLDAFFFSVQTFTTVGYGILSPHGTLANSFAALCAFVGLLSFAMATGLLFARFSRPTARIIFAENAIITPFQEASALMFRIANARKNQLIELEVKILYSRLEFDNGRHVRRYYALQLVRDKVVFFPLQWTVVHKIDENSPLLGITQKRLEEEMAEFPILLTGIDETFSQSVHARSSYRFDEIKWNVKFSDMFFVNKNNQLSSDMQKLSDTEAL
jgi:inward rectifier potassium channel